MSEETPDKRMKEALGPELGSDAVEATGQVVFGFPRNRFMLLVAAIVAIVAMQLAALFIVPPYACEPGVVPCEPAADPNQGFAFPRDAILANFEMPAPHVVFGEAPSADILTFQLSVPASIFTGWIVMLVIIVLAILLARRIEIVPGGRQNVLEYVYEGLANLATSLGGPAARRYVPVFLAFFIFIVMSNWSGLLPFVGRTYELRAPTSDVNVTIGLALVAFTMFHVEGVRRLGFGGYFGKFFNFGAFRQGIGAGIIGLFVGLLEFLLEFVKPVTLSMRLFGNIYAGEIALGVISALTIFLIPVAMFGLEVLLNFMQALIFSALALMFTLAAIEPHHEEHHDDAEHPPMPEGNIQPAPNGQAAHA
ncbi:MAG TPA: F0F1 ATP synthase subunit A [Candidatus Limnocylindrales bacterium]|nr:F0F1 ATP synthase subunit A [Candidatus Limnocylindrales bacterium]